MVLKIIVRVRTFIMKDNDHDDKVRSGGQWRVRGTLDVLDKIQKAGKESWNKAHLDNQREALLSTIYRNDFGSEWHRPDVPWAFVVTSAAQHAASHTGTRVSRT